MAITRIWVLFAVKDAWLFSAFGSYISVVNCSHGIVAITRIWVLFAVKAVWLFGFCLIRSQLYSSHGGYYTHVGLEPAFRSCLQPMRRGYFGHLGFVCRQGRVPITRIWALFSVKATWLLPAFGSCLVCSHRGVAIIRI